MGRRGVAVPDGVTNHQRLALLVFIPILLISFYMSCDNALLGELKYPEINIKQGNSVIANNGISPSFANTAVGSSSSLTFTIENTGTDILELTGVSVAIGGANAEDFSISADPSIQIPASGGTTTFEVTFSPASVGAKTAVLTIFSNDKDEGTFTIALNGFAGSGAADTKDITAFSIGGATGIITGTDIAVTVPSGTDVTSLIADFTTSGDTVAVGATPQISGTTANNFTAPVTYTVTAADSSEQVYTVTVTVAAASAAKDITAYSIGGATGVITGTDIAVTVPSGTSVASLIATFSSTGSTVSVVGVDQTSGITTNNFTNPVTYTVTALDDSTKYYIVTVTVAPAGVDYAYQSTNIPSAGVIDQAFNGDFRLMNQGAVDGVFTVAWTVYLSDNTSIDGGDTEVQTSTLSPLTAGSNSSFINYAGTWPANSGTYYIIIEVTAGDDTNSGNNVFISSAISVTEIVDYSVVASPVFPATGILDGAISGNFRIINNGTLNGTASVNWTVYRSANATYDGGDVQVDSGSQTQLNAGVTSGPILFNGTWPGTADTYYLIIVLSAADEGDTSNDELASSAIGVIDSGRFVIVGAGGLIMYSDDGAITWTSATLTPGTSTTFLDVATNGAGMWVAVGESKKLYYSTDNALSWQLGTIALTNGSSQDLTGVAYGNGHWVLTGLYIGGETTTAYSTDGINWTLKVLTNTYNITGVTYDVKNSRWIAVGSGTNRWFRSDTYDADWISGAMSRANINVFYGGDRVVAVGGTDIKYLTSGTTWITATTIPISGIVGWTLRDVTYDGSISWVAVGSRAGGYPATGMAFYSTDGGITWTSAGTITSAGYENRLYAVTYDPKSGRFVAGGSEGNLKYSTDGGNVWIDNVTGFINIIWGIAVGP